MNKTNTIPLIAGLLKNESEIDDIQRRWKNSEHPLNNPKGYGYSEGLANKNILDHEYQTTRLLHLDQLKKIINDDLKLRPEYYESGKLSNHDAIKKYISKCVEIPFPYPQDRETVEIKNRVQWVNNRKSYSPINNASTEADYHKFCELRFNKLLLLARVCNFIDQIQVEDYKKNKIVILLNGEFSGKTNELIYGEKHSLSAYLGQWIIRLFPFKDYYGFVSEKHKEQKRKGSETVYEHFTPMSFFRDLIWFKMGENDKFIFHYTNEENKAYTVEEWLSFLWYRYRTVWILECEDKGLSEKGEKSRRSAGNEAYTDVMVEGKKQDIKIHFSMDKAWEEVHKIERLRNLIP